MKEKKLLIVERNSNNLQINEDNDSIVLTGLFTSFNTKNRNGRIYESSDFLPHVEALKDQINAKSLLGEMDHPHGFEISLGNVSHVIESLEYDPQQNAIIGKVRLLNTARGRDAQALVRDGIPLHISSRAAGTVDGAGKVKLQQLFTYDLVADPGFANAVLTRVNEGVETNQISDETRTILQRLNENYQNINEKFNKVGEFEDAYVYEVSEDANTNLKPETSGEGQKPNDMGNDQTSKNVEELKNTDKNKNMDNNGQDYILYSDFQKYSEHLSEIISDLQSAIANYKTELADVKTVASSKPTETFDAANVDNSMIADLVAKEVAKSLPAAPEAPEAEQSKVNTDELEAQVKAMEEKYENLVKYTKYLAETLDKSICHQDYITEETNKLISHNDYLVENMNNMIKHQDYLAENIDDTIEYQKYVAEMLDKSIDYSNMLAEEQNKTIAHADYLAEKMNQMVQHQDYIAEEANKIIEHNNYLAENMNNMIEHQNYIAESVNNALEGNANVIEENNNEVVETPSEIKEEKTVVFDTKQYQNDINEKLNAIISTVKTQYAEAQQKEAEALAESKQNSKEEKNFTLINYLPARLNERWSKLSDTRKQEILAESKMFVINNAASAEYFWNTRDLREKQIEVQKVEESATAQPTASLNESVMENDRYKMMSEMIKNRMRRY